MQGTPLRILLDFDRYYDDDDRVELAEEAKAGGLLAFVNLHAED